jgi:hypothetical protein
VAAAIRLADLPAQAYAHRNLANAWNRMGRLDDAHTHLRYALDLYQAACHRVGQAAALNTVGWSHAQLGDHRLAIIACQPLDRYGVGR